MQNTFWGDLRLSMTSLWSWNAATAEATASNYNCGLLVQLAASAAFLGSLYSKLLVKTTQRSLPGHLKLPARDQVGS